MPSIRSILITWIGRTDLEAAEGNPKAGLGPIAQAVVDRDFDEVHLVSDYPKAQSRKFLDWLNLRSTGQYHLHLCTLSGPTEFGEIYESVVSVLTALQGSKGEELGLTFHLSPGTPAMAAVWVILSKTRFPAELIESSRESGVRTVAVPFDISADFIPDLLRRPDRELERLAQGLPPAAPEFDAIMHRSTVMKRVVARARRVAPRSVPVLLEGESGTGKELFARAIHQASTRRDQPFIVVNCGAIPSEMVEAELFGHQKGAFTGAASARIGYFEAADGGTLFLDEIGELPKAAQVKLLRVLQEGEVTRLGSTQAKRIDVRVISATNRTLSDEVADGAFREDLFYRLAVAVIQLPPLRDREGDTGLLVDQLLTIVNEESASEPAFKHKKLSANARNVLLHHSWPGNVRELLNTLRRAVVWSGGTTVDEPEIREAILPVAGSATIHDKIPLIQGPENVEEGVDLNGVLGQISASYIRKALEATRGNKTEAASLLGLKNYQTLTNWMKKYGIED